MTGTGGPQLRKLPGRSDEMPSFVSCPLGRNKEGEEEEEGEAYWGETQAQFPKQINSTPFRTRLCVKDSKRSGGLHISHRQVLLWWHDVCHAFCKPQGVLANYEPLEAGRAQQFAFSGGCANIHFGQGPAEFASTSALALLFFWQQANKVERRKSDGTQSNR